MVEHRPCCGLHSLGCFRSLPRTLTVETAREGGKQAVIAAGWPWEREVVKERTGLGRAGLGRGGCNEPASLGHQVLLKVPQTTATQGHSLSKSRMSPIL